MIVVVAAAGLFIYLRVRSDLTETLDTGLRQRADDLAALVATSGGGGPEVSSQRIVESDEGFSQILRPDGTLVDSTLAPDAGPQIDSETLVRARSGSVLLSKDEVPGIENEARILVRPASSPSGEFVVVAGASTQDRSEALSGITGALLVGAPFALLIASGLGYLLAARSLAPVEAMRRRAAEITLEEGDERLPLPRADDEVRRLGETLNEMLDRLEASIERQRAFVADAGHELRTPLAVLRAELDLAGRSSRTRDELQAALESASEEADRLSRLAEDLLVVARSDQGRLPIKREPVKLAELLRRIGDRFGAATAESGREIAVEARDDLSAELDPLRIEQAVGNLIDNAVRHGDGKVQLAARNSGGRLLLEVSDEGAGFPPGFAEQAFERFSRADDGRTGGGAGLGLAIVEAIAEAHGGTASIAATGDRRTTIRIELPLRPRPE